MILLMGIFVTNILASQAFTRFTTSSRANNEFSLNLYKSLPPTGNIFYSPASIFIALGMQYKGAAGNTAQEMRTALSYDTARLRDESVHQNLKDLLESFENPCNEYKLEIANAIVASSSYPISEDYKETLKTYFKTVIKEVDFKSGKKAALDDINNWVREKTQGKINKFSDDLDDDTVMVVLNAVHFKGTWETLFDENLTRDGDFYANGKDVKRVKMMNAEREYQYGNFPRNKYHALKLPYKGEDFSMILVLPFEKDGLRDLEKILTMRKLLEIVLSVDERKRKVKVSIPKFKLEHSINLVENLKQLGMRDAFTNGTADFSGIDKSRRIFISDVVHKAVIEVNEKENEDVAATSAAWEFKSFDPRKVEFIVDHPFLFFIQNEKTAMVLCMGRVNEL